MLFGGHSVVIRWSFGSHSVVIEYIECEDVVFWNTNDVKF